MSKIGMGQNKLVADKFQEWKDKGSKPEDLMALRDLAMATAPNAPVTAAIGKRYDSMVTERQLASSEQGNAVQRVQTALALHKQPDPADLLLLQGGSRTIKNSPSQDNQVSSEANKATAQMFGDTSFTPLAKSASMEEAFPSSNVDQNQPAIVTKPVASSGSVNSSVIPRVESGTNDKAVSPKGASAAWQVMHNTAKDPGYGVVPAKDNSFEELNRVGQDYWNALHSKFGSSTLADIAYNMGPDKAQKWIDSGANWSKLPKETRDYISQTNLLRDVPSSKSAAESEKTPPQKVAPSTQNAPYPVLHPKVSASDIENMPQDMATQEIEAAKSRAKVAEELADSTVENLKPYTNEALVQKLVSSYKKTDGLMTKYPEYAQAYYNKLGQGDTLAALLHSAQKGAAVNLTGILNGTASISIPTDAWVGAKLPKEIKSFGDTMMTERAKQIALEAKLQGQNITQIPVAEFSTVVGSHPNEDVQWDAARHQVRNAATDVFFMGKKAQQFTKEFNTKNLISKDELAPKSSILTHSPNLKNIQKAWDVQKSILDRAREDELKPKQ
jgi:hypothetical protein